MSHIPGQLDFTYSVLRPYKYNCQTMSCFCLQKIFSHMHGLGALGSQKQVFAFFPLECGSQENLGL